MTLLYAEARPAYEPLDELLREPVIQILRALARLEWCTARDLFLAIDVPLDADSENRYQQQLRRLCLRGDLDRRPSLGIDRYRGASRHFDYCINAAGRARLARELERANPERELAGRTEDDPEFLYQLARRETTGSAARRASRERRARLRKGGSP